MSKKIRDAIELLDADHRAVKSLFDTYSVLSGHNAGSGRRKALAEQICLELTIHMRLEEEIFYPPVREAIRDDDLLDEAEVEHAGVRELIAQILSMRPADELYDAKVTVLGAYIGHHVKEEQEALFPKVRRCGLDLASLGEQLQLRRQKLLELAQAPRENALVSVSA